MEEKKRTLSFFQLVCLGSSKIRNLPKSFFLKPVIKDGRMLKKKMKYFQLQFQYLFSKGKTICKEENFWVNHYKRQRCLCEMILTSYLINVYDV